MRFPGNYANLTGSWILKKMVKLLHLTDFVDLEDKSHRPQGEKLEF